MLTAPGPAPAGEDLLRRLAPQVLGALVRRYGHFDAAEDAVQEALLAAARQWPEEGRPANPRGWLIRVASRRLTDQLRREEARRRREETAAALTPRDAFVAPPPGEGRAPAEDDTLALLFLCCRAELPPAGRIALTLRAVGGLTTAEIARALLVPETTMAQRISRAKRRIKASGTPFGVSPDDAHDAHDAYDSHDSHGAHGADGTDGTGPQAAADRAARLADVLHVLYLIFNEGYTATSGRDLQRSDLAAEAIRLTRAVHAQLPADGEVAGLLALMLLTDARRAARTTPDGDLIPSPNRTARAGTAPPSPKGSPWSATPSPVRRWVLTSCARRSRPCTTRRRATRTPTGWRSSPCTRYWSGWSPAPWSAWATRSRWPWCTGPGGPWPCSKTWTGTSGWPVTTASRPYGPTCWRGRARGRRRGPPTRRPPGSRSAFRSAATSCCGQPGSRSERAGPRSGRPHDGHGPPLSEAPPTLDHVSPTSDDHLVPERSLAEINADIRCLFARAEGRLSDAERIRHALLLGEWASAIRASVVPAA